MSFPLRKKSSIIAFKIIAINFFLLLSCSPPEETDEYEFTNEGGDCIDYFHYEMDKDNECYFESTKTKAFCLSRDHQVTQEVLYSFVHNSRNIIILSTNAGPTEIITQNGFHICGDKPGDVCIHPL